MKRNTDREWILLVHQLPQKPTRLRVHAWRRLRALGAVPVKNSVYVLPYSEKTNEDFQWLKQEIESSGGEANLFRAGSVEGAADDELIAVFRKERDEDYAELIVELDALSGAVREQLRGGSLSPGRLANYQADLSKLRQALERVAAIDFFQAPQGEKARKAFEKCRMQLQATESKYGRASAGKVDPAILKIDDFQNRRWITRKDPHIDRLASGWLIRRFIDKRPRFHFIADGESDENGITFDMAGGDLTHRGNDCTFETIIASFGLGSDAALQQVAEIIHDIDLKDNKFNRSETSGVNAVVMGIAAIYRNDSERLKQCYPVFDALYELFAKAPGIERTRKRNAKRKGSN